MPPWEEVTSIYVFKSWPAAATTTSGVSKKRVIVLPAGAISPCKAL